MHYARTWLPSATVRNLRASSFGVFCAVWMGLLWITSGSEAGVWWADAIASWDCVWWRKRLDSGVTVGILGWYIPLPANRLPPNGAGAGIARGFGTGTPSIGRLDASTPPPPSPWVFSSPFSSFAGFLRRAVSFRGRASSRQSPSLFPSSLLDGARARRGRR